MLGRGIHLKPITILVFFLWLAKSLKNLDIECLLINLKNIVSFLIFSMIPGVLDQLQIF